MSVIAWDGETLAGDRQVNFGTHIGSVTKVFEHEGELIGLVGNWSQCMQMLDWYKNRDEYMFPVVSENTWSASMMVISKDENKETVIEIYETEEYPIVVEDLFFALGCGALGAMCVMGVGLSAEQAVRTVNLYESDCGEGCDTVTFGDN